MPWAHASRRCTAIFWCRSKPGGSRLLHEITPMILTLNEEANIGRTLAKLTWARRILVIDSGSTDRTLEIVRQHPQAVVIRRDFDSAAAQCNFGLTHIDSEWVLSLDADYVLSDELISEIGSLRPADNIRGFWARFRLSDIRSRAASLRVSAARRALPQVDCGLCRRRPHPAGAHRWRAVASESSDLPR